MFGIKEEEPEKEDDKNKTNENKVENKDIKIIEITLNFPITERVLQKSNKKQVKPVDSEKEKEKPTKNLISISKVVEKKNNIENSEIKNAKNDNLSNTTNKNIFETKPVNNPFISLLSNNNNSDKNKDNIDNEKEKPKLSLFGDMNNKNEKEKPKLSLFGDMNNKNEKEKPKFSLFGDMNNKNENDKGEAQKSQSLFGNINIINNNNTNSIFSSNTPLFSNNNGQSLFSGNNGKSLFSDNFGNKPLFPSDNTDNSGKNKSLFTPNLFSNNNNNLNTNPFSEIKGDSFIQSLFNNNNKDNKGNGNKVESLFDDNNNNDGDEEEDERDKPKKNYVTEPLKAQDYSEYSKLYNTHLNNLFLYNKKHKQFISKGNGFFSIEKTKDEKNQNHQAVVVFRNQTGNKIVEGFVDKKFDKFDIINKDFNFVVSFGIIMVSDGKPEFGYIKIPFKSEENANELKDAFEKALVFIEEKK